MNVNRKSSPSSINQFLIEKQTNHCQNSIELVHRIHKVTFIEKRSLSGELVVAWVSASGGVLFYFKRKELL